MRRPIATQPTTKESTNKEIGEMLIKDVQMLSICKSARELRKLAANFVLRANFVDLRGFEALALLHLRLQLFDLIQLFKMRRSQSVNRMQ